MSTNHDAIDLTADDDVAIASSSSSSANDISNTLNGTRKRKADTSFIPQHVWVAIHQLEASYHCVGDFSKHGRHLSHCPTTFDATILGIFLTKDAANRCAMSHWVDLGHDEYDEDDDDEDDSLFDFEGDGKYFDGAESGNVNTFSERVFIKHQALRNT
jgi:hypothetical protein